MPGYYQTLQQSQMHMLPYLMQQRRLADMEMQQQYARRLQAQQLQRQYDQQALQERGRQENQRRMYQVLGDQNQQRAMQNAIALKRLEAEIERMKQPRFGAVEELVDEKGKTRQVLRDAKSGDLYDALTKQPLGAASGTLQKPKPIPEKLRSDLGAIGGNIQDLTALAKSFKPEYTNALGPQIGELENVVRKYAPLPQAVVSTEMPNWWNSYKRVAEIPERHKVAGATLTPREQAMWSQVEVNPGMKPEDILRSLNIRTALLHLAAGRTMASASTRFNRQEIQRAAGLDIPENVGAGNYDLDELNAMGSRLTGAGRPPLDQILQQ